MDGGSHLFLNLAAGLIDLGAFFHRHFERKLDFATFFEGSGHGLIKEEILLVFLDGHIVERVRGNRRNSLKRRERNADRPVLVVILKNEIRRAVIFNKKENEYFIITSKDILNNIKGNYNLFLEKKLKKT